MSDPDFIRAIAASEVQLYSESRRAFIAEHSSAAKWLMASLLTLNAGGLAVLGRHFGGSASEMIAAAGFYVGIVSALLVGWLGQRANRACLEPLRELEVFWIEVGFTGKFEDARLNDLLGKLRAAGKNKATLSGWLSLIAFSIGLFALIAPAAHLSVSQVNEDATADNVEMPADQMINSHD